MGNQFEGAEGPGGGKRAKLVDTTGSGKDGERRAPLVDLADNRNVIQTADSRKYLPADEVRKLVGSEDEYMRKAPGQLREQLKLPAGASSEDVYHAMANEFVKAFHSASHQLQQEGLRRLGINRTQAQNPDTVFSAMVKSDKQQFGLKPSASFSDLEKAKHHWDYHHMTLDFD